MLGSCFTTVLILPVLNYGDIIWGDRGNLHLWETCKSCRTRLPVLFLTYHLITLVPRVDAADMEATRSLKIATSGYFYVCVTNMFLHNFDNKESRDIHGYNTRRNKDIRKFKSSTYWGQWSTINRAGVRISF